MQILDERNIQYGSRIRCYASRRAVRVAGELQLIPDVVQVEEGLAGEYTIRSGMDWIRMQPKADADLLALRAASELSIADSYHFGPVIKTARLGGDSLTYVFSYSSGVVYDEQLDALVFKHAPECGLFLNRWKSLLGRDLVLDLPNRIATLQLADLRDAIEAEKLDRPSIPGEINLDPETTLSLDAVANYLAYDTGWPTIRAQPTGDVNAQIVLVAYIGCNVQIRRSIVEFNTAALGTPLSAHVYLYREGSSGAELRLIGNSASYGALTTTSNYGAILTAKNAGHTIGGAWASNTPSSGWLKSPDIVAADRYVQSADFRLGLMQAANDWANYGPGGLNIDYGYVSTGANAAYLELIYPDAGGGTSTSTSTMAWCGLR